MTFESIPQQKIGLGSSIPIGSSVRWLTSRLETDTCGCAATAVDAAGVAAAACGTKVPDALIAMTTPSAARLDSFRCRMIAPSCLASDVNASDSVDDVAEIGRASCRERGGGPRWLLVGKSGLAR